ncbi:acid protease [Westerdykella ornata]|uniref:Acid protease n=1 Tax=Westerdykella ornata TaxID=318751 RepID=A0A6A6JGS3_WESOR|nr:acid protease [Westerdykella ornata]KAF2274419.1 acid protease [Westerdykella ornata]
MGLRVALTTTACALAALLPPVLPQVLEPRADTTPSPLPAPLSIDPAQNWDGIDGSWNTFPIRVGTPDQPLRVLVSTASQQTWVVFEKGCWYDEPDAADPTGEREIKVLDRGCQERRGRTFNMSTSSTWDEIGFYQLWLEKNLGILGNGKYGYEKVGLGYTPDNGPTLDNTTVGALITDVFWLGHFGLNPKPTNFTSFVDPSPSYMTLLFQKHMIPSVAWGYTAGAQYHHNSVLGSLTLGGYDASRLIPNDLTFGFAPDNERDIVVGVVGIHANGKTKKNVDLLARDQFTMYIDSTVAELYLPKEVCAAFEREFGLKYDNATDLYLVDDALHESLLAENPTIVFSLGQKFSTNATVDIELPYAAFDHTAKWPYRNLTEDHRYFPIRRAERENQFVLGRTFLQEAYLVVDWERQNFSVSQCNWTYGVPKQIVPILSPVYTGEDIPGHAPKHGTASLPLSTGAIIGIAIGGGFTFAMLGFALGWFFWRRRQRRRHEEVKARYAAQDFGKDEKDDCLEKHEETPTSPSEEGTNVFPKAELPADPSSGLGADCKDREGASPVSPGGLPSPVVEVENTERQIFEMEGDIPTRQEADGRLLSEKESMIVRERKYNGVDPYGPPPISPSSTETPRRPAPVSPSEVTLVSRRPDLSPVTPRTPRTPRDGASLEANDTFFQPPTSRTPRDGRFLEAEDTLLSPISPLDETPRRRFSYES